MRIAVFFAIQLIGTSFLFGQKVNGVIIDGSNDKKLANVKVVNESTGAWTMTDQNGHFSIKYSDGSKITFYKSGWIGEFTEMMGNEDQTLDIKLFPASIRIQEVNLVAKKNKFSAIEITEEALQKNQSFSLGDILQQLPGQYVEPMRISEMKNIVLRTADAGNVFGNNGPSGQDFGNKAFGTQIMINDIAMSNNSNMQSFNAAYDNPFNQGFSISTNKGKVTPAQPNYGIDLRQVPTEDIEKIEVIAGIPDAKYGDLTSGLVKVETKSGRRPLQVLTSLNAGTYQLGASKGFLLNENGDALNVSINYMNSKADPRFSDVVYNRFNTNIQYTISNTTKTFRNRFGLTIMSDTNKGQAGENEYNGIYVEGKNKNYSISNNTNIKFDSKWVKQVNANIGVTYGNQFSLRRNFINSYGLPYGNAMEDSVYFAPYMPPQYFNHNYVEGIPFNIFTDIDAGTDVVTKSGWIHNLSLGFNYRYADNFGRGRYGDLNQFSASNSVGGMENGSREYDFEKGVRSSTQVGLYFQDNITKNFANQHKLQLNAGLRYDIQNDSSILSPRINSSYRMKNVTLRAGVGLASKAPSLNQLYTGPRFVDMLLGDYRLPGAYSVAIMQTAVIPAINNESLKPSKSWRSEVGIDFKLPFANISLTGYNNQLTDGFTTQGSITELDKALVTIHQTGTEAPTFSITGTQKLRFLQSVQTNALESKDVGLETIWYFKRIERLNLNVSLKGSYTKTTGTKSVNSLVQASIDDQEVAYGIFAPHKTFGERASAGIMLDYHIPRAGLVISINSDHFLYEAKGSNSTKKPIAYLDQDLFEHAMTDEMLNNPAIIGMTNSGSGVTAFSSGGQTFHNFHFRVSKEFQSGIRISVYLNNMFNLRAYDPLGYEYQNFTPISFGGNISYQF